MDEHEFDALFPYRSFGTKEATEHYALIHRSAALASALFGKRSEDLRQQLLAPHPKIPSGFTLKDFRELQRRTEMLLNIDPTSPQFAWLQHFNASRPISVGTQRYSMLEAQYEIIRRAIDFLENQD